MYLLDMEVDQRIFKEEHGSNFRLAFRNKASPVILDLTSMFRCREWNSEDFITISGGNAYCACGAVIPVLR